MSLPKYNGSLASYFNSDTKSALTDGLGTKVENIDFEKLIPHADNFYGMRDIPALARDMSISNWIEPLRVQKSTDNSNKYVIISGERRYRAVKYRYENKEISSRDIPCIVTDAPKDDDILSAEMKTNIAIIVANSHREKSVTEKLQELDLLEPVARAYYNHDVAQGNYKGNFRQYFAEVFFKTSSTSLQRLQSLKKLIPEFLTTLDNDEGISKSAAEELAKHSHEEQYHFYEEWQLLNEKEKVTASFIREFFQRGKTQNQTAESAGEGAYIPQQHLTDNPISTSSFEEEQAALPQASAITVSEAPKDQGAHEPVVNDADADEADMPIDTPTSEADYEVTMAKPSINTVPAEEPAEADTSDESASQDNLPGVDVGKDMGLFFVIDYLTKGLDDSKKNLADAEKLHDTELIAHFRMEVASFEYAIVKLQA